MTHLQGRTRSRSRSRDMQRSRGQRSRSHEGRDDCRSREEHRESRSSGNGGDSVGRSLAAKDQRQPVSLRPDRQRSSSPGSSLKQGSLEMEGNDGAEDRSWAIRDGSEAGTRGPPRAIKGDAKDSSSEEEGWIMTDDELQALLRRHRARGRGGVGSRADEVGPYLPEGYEETR